MRRRPIPKIVPLLVLGLAAVLAVSCAPPRPGLPPQASATTGLPASVRFGIVTDIHYADIEPRGSRPYRESPAKLKECVVLMNREKPDFLVELGDLKDQDDKPNERKTLGYLRKIESVFAGFAGPRYHVLGNHDVDGLSKAQFLGIAPNPGVPPEWSYYRFDVRGVRFLALDADFLANGDPFDHGKFAWADCNIPPAEMDWLRSELTASPKPVIVFIHQQLDGQGDYYVRNAAAVRGLLERSGKVLAVFQGHRHEGAFTRIKGIPYYTLKGMVEGSGPEHSSYALVDVDARGTIKIQGFRQADSLTLKKETP
jgi:predicted phosphodiesterase